MIITLLLTFIIILFFVFINFISIKVFINFISDEIPPIFNLYTTNPCAEEETYIPLSFTYGLEIYANRLSQVFGVETLFSGDQAFLDQCCDFVQVYYKYVKFTLYIYYVI